MVCGSSMRFKVFCGSSIPKYDPQRLFCGGILSLNCFSKQVNDKLIQILSFKPFWYACHGSFVGVRRGVGPVECLNLTKKNYAYSGPFTFTDLCPKRFEKSFDCGPFKTPANRSGFDV